MTTAEKIVQLVTDVVGAIGRQFYGDRIDDFMRDRHALRQAVSRYGQICHERGWEFSPEFIKKDLLDLLNQVKRQGTDAVQYLPTYLDGAVSRHVKLRAEKLHAEAKDPRNLTRSVVKAVSVKEAVREPSAVELLATLRAAEARERAANRAAKQMAKKKACNPVATAPKPVAQPSLF